MSAALALSWLLCALAAGLLRVRFLAAMRYAADWIAFPALFGWDGAMCGRIGLLWGCAWPLHVSIAAGGWLTAGAVAVELVGGGLIPRHRWTARPVTT